MIFTKIGSATTKSLVAVSILFGSTAASASTACQPGTGCVLPIADAPPPMVSEAPPPPLEAAPVAEAVGGGLSLLAILAGLAALGLLAYFLLDDDEEDDDGGMLPVSP
jgi:hypothetical protein